MDRDAQLCAANFHVCFGLILRSFVSTLLFSYFKLNESLKKTQKTKKSRSCSFARPNLDLSTNFISPGIGQVLGEQVMENSLSSSHREDRDPR